MIDVVHADEHVVVIDKPAGLPAVPGRPVELHDCAASRVRERFADARVVHRLDQPTSGLLLFARGEAAQRQLGAAFAAHAVDKRYIAVVEGLPASDAGTIDAPIGADWSQRPRRHVDARQGKPSVTHWRVLSRDPAQRRTRLELRPVTGRTHQLRVHCAAIGHPILGDALYAGDAARDAAPRLLLHAVALAFDHPAHGARIALFREPPF